MFSWLRASHPIHPIETQFGAPAEAILEAISRASDLSRRGVLGLIAEAFFKIKILDAVDRWSVIPEVGDRAYDYLITDGVSTLRIQVKRQRLLKGVPMRYPRNPTKHVAETQKSRTGKDSATGENTRPYRFGDFDLLAVSMQPSTGNWASFMYTPQAWLLPRVDNPGALQVLQPVSAEANDDWTDDIQIAIARCLAGKVHRIAE